MKILANESYTRVKKTKKKKDLVPTIVDRIFLICREDPNFSVRKEISQVDEKLTDIQEKLRKQDGLLSQANELHKNVSEKIEVIDDESFRIKVKVLESLGSEL